MGFKPYSGEMVADKNAAFKPYEGETVDDPNYTPPKEGSFFDKVKDTFVNAASTAIGSTINPIGTLNKIPGVERLIPDTLYGDSQEKGIAKGGYNAARNTLQLGADVQDFMIPGDATPMSDLLSSVPEAKYSGGTETVAGNITEIASGFLLGNKMAAAAKVGKLGEDAVVAVQKLAPEATHKLITHLASLIKSGSQGIAGTAVTTAPGSTNVVVGDKSLVTKLGLGPMLEGLPTDSPDAAQNALAARVNTAIDGFITGAGIGESIKVLKVISNATVGKHVIDKMSPLWSTQAKLKVFFEQIGDEFAKLKGGDTEAGLEAIHKRAAELAGNPDAGAFTRDLGIPGVDKIDESLDTATTVGRQINKAAPDELDQGIKSTLEGEAKKLGQKGYEATAVRREAPARSIDNALEQTQVALGGPEVARTGANEVQNLGNKVVKQGISERQMAEVTAVNALGTANPRGPSNMIESINRAKDTRVSQVNELYDAIPKDAKYEGVSINKIIADNKDVMPDEIIELLGKDSDGSFAFLNNKVRPRVSAMLKKLETAANPLTREQRAEVKALKALRDNIDKDQLKSLKDSGRSDVVDAATKAKQAYEAEIAQNRQGVVGEVQDIQAKNGLNTDDTFSESRAALKKAIDADVREPEHNKRLLDVLSSDEGGRNEEALTRYREATDKAKELENIEHDIYGDKLREFFDQRSVFPGSNNPNGVDAFQMLLDDKQNANRVKYILDLGEKEGSPAVKKALQYSVAKKIHDRLFTGHLTANATEKVSGPGVRSLLNDEGLMAAGDAAFKDTPEFMVAVKDTLELANDIQRSGYLKAAPKGKADSIVASAKAGLRTAISPILGPLSHKGYMAKTYFGALLDVLKPQAAVDRMADALMADGQAYARAYKMLTDPKVSKKTGETVMKVLTASLLRTNGEREQFDKKFKQLDTDNQTEEVLKK